MIEIKNTETVGWEHAIRGMRNPLNSWNKMDSKYNFNTYWDDECTMFNEHIDVELGENDLSLAIKLANAGADHSKFLRMIVVYCDITAPMYWWKEFDTYKVGTVRNSCSTMHKIHSKEFDFSDFSFENLSSRGHFALGEIIQELNYNRNKFVETKNKMFWFNLIQLLPSSYNQKSTVMLNYQVLKNIYHSRKNHKLDEWHIFCEWIAGLPYAKELIVGE